MRFHNWLSRINTRLGFGLRTQRRRSGGLNELQKAQQAGMAIYAGCQWKDVPLEVEPLENRTLLTGTLQLSAATYVVSEGVGNSTVVMVNRTGVTSGTASVDVNLGNVTAVSGSDYLLTAITLNFAANQTSATATIPIVNDRRVEGTETFTATLANADAGTAIGALNAATVTITDNDFAVIDAQVDQSVSEGAAAPTVGVTLTINATGSLSQPIGLDSPVSVTLTDALSGTASSGGVDYSFTNATVMFAAGDFASSTMTTPVMFTDDQLVEAAETINFTVGSLSTTLNGQVGLGDTTH
ncbi:MAG TPA: Calx-beta domain-containing protein, partial [Planctomycetaceae bacterium]|nr:Calx-beta domain-containing protein [Planctomycetaceae bacterium]